MQFVYCTVPDEETARAIAHRIVEARLAACVNLLGPIHSVYRWEGKVEAADEWALIAKTVASSFRSLRDRIRALHPYDCPCIVALPVTGGWPAFLDWIRAETGPEADQEGKS